MISSKLKHVASNHKLLNIRFDASGPIVQVSSWECLELFLDEETGGVWYRLNPAKMAIPMEQGLVYVYPAALRAIQFYE